MSRQDAIGFFWQDIPVRKEKKAAPPKRQPPERTWESPNYLPDLEEARAYRVQQFEDWELAIAAAKRERLVFDIECYPNFFHISFVSLASGKVIYFERTSSHDFNASKLMWMVRTFCLVSFNGLNYDEPMLALALAGCSPAQLHEATELIILQNQRPSDVLRKYKVKPLKLNHIDLIEVAPLRASLKIYGGRMHTPKMQDLPFPPGTILTPDQMSIVRWYCVNDLTNTAFLHENLKEQLQLREVLGQEYELDLRSKSDAQIAEAVIVKELEKLTRSRVQRPVVAPGTVYRYRVPSFIRYETPLMNWVLGVIANSPFVVSEEGNVELPPSMGILSDPGVTIAGNTYTIRIGGLHSTEKRSAHVEDDEYEIADRDVTSYYPYIILNLGLFPHHLGTNFLKVYKELVDRRIRAKRAGRKAEADSLKITVNGSFGKLASKYSALYSPDLLIQVTVTGQLALLMLIERLELRGFTVVSANTDGIVIKYRKDRRAEFEAIVAQWEAETRFETEETRYRAIYSRDVNNYIAVKHDGKVKLKGAYADAGLSKNPVNQICVDAVIKLLTDGVPIVTTVSECRDIRRFVNVRTVDGGAVKDGEYLGKSIRWYYAQGEKGEIIAAKTGNRVPKSIGARPMLEMPKEFPSDVDFEWYVREAERILKDIGYQVD